MKLSALHWQASSSPAVGAGRRTSALRRWAASLSAAVVLLAGLACQSAAPAPAAPPPTNGDLLADIDGVTIDRPLTLRFWRRSGNAASETVQQEIVKRFEAENPNIKVETRLYGDYNTLYTQTLGAIQADRPPDVVADYETWAAEYYEQGALLPLDAYVKSGRYGLSQQIGRAHV